MVKGERIQSTMHRIAECVSPKGAPGLNFLLFLNPRIILLLRHQVSSVNAHRVFVPASNLNRFSKSSSQSLDVAGCMSMGLQEVLQSIERWAFMCWAYDLKKPASILMSGVDAGR